MVLTRLLIASGRADLDSAQKPWGSPPITKEPVLPMTQAGTNKLRLKDRMI